MTQKQFDILTDPLCRAVIEEYIDADPAAVAADKALARRLDAAFGPGSGALSTVATQIKYLGRARTKLPHYYAARCIIPPLAFEQAGSMECAAHKTYGGGLCIDLTCGLGVDSANFARRFTHVVAVERDPLLAAVARENFARLGIRNIGVVNAAAEDFLAGDAPHADLIYADPDRRGAANRKLVLLEDCAPDVVALRDRMGQLSGRIVVKVSPLFDHAEAVRLFGPGVCVEAVSLNGECKEMLIETGSDIAGVTLKASVAGGETFACDAAQAQSAACEEPFAPPYNYLIVPDAALRKMRLTAAYFAGQQVCVSANGYGFARQRPGGTMFRALAIERIFTDLKSLKEVLRRRGAGTLQIMQRDFPLSNREIARRLGVREGGGAAAAFTTIAGRQIAVLLS